MTDACEFPGHRALLYQGDAEYLTGVVPFVEEGLTRGEPVAIAVPGRNLVLLQKALGARADRVRLIDLVVAGRNPGAILPTVLLAFAAEHPGPVRLVCEPVWRERTPAEYSACVQHEALLNHAFVGRPARVLCPYDTADLSRFVLADAERTHPQLQDGAGPRPSRAFDPARLPVAGTEPLVAPPTATERPFDTRQLGAVRGFAEIWAARHGLRRPRRDDFTLAVAELTTNSVLYAGGEGLLRLWVADGAAVAEVSDKGTLGDPLAGRIPPAAGRPGGRGLLLVNRLADLVRTYWIPGRTTTRIHFGLGA